VIIGEDEFDDDGVHTPSRYDKTKKEAKSIRINFFSDFNILVR
jgi:hypothetical protein